MDLTVHIQEINDIIISISLWQNTEVSKDKFGESGWSHMRLRRSYRAATSKDVCW